jgi:hypothetical protein
MKTLGSANFKNGGAKNTHASPTLRLYGCDHLMRYQINDWIISRRIITVSLKIL